MLGRISELYENELANEYNKGRFDLKNSLTLDLDFILLITNYSRKIILSIETIIAISDINCKEATHTFIHIYPRHYIQRWQHT